MSWDVLGFMLCSQDLVKMMKGLQMFSVMARGSFKSRFKHMFNLYGYLERRNSKYS